MAEIWRESFHVRSSEVGADGRMSPVGLCGLLQEVAGNHASSLGVGIETLAGRGVGWVLSRLHVEVSSMPSWRDAVTLSTWPSGYSRLLALREFRLEDAAGAEVAVATSAWLVVDLDRRRPVRPLPEVLALAPRSGVERALADDFASSLPDARGEHTALLEARYPDLDLNQHVNNLVLVSWLLAPVPEAEARRPLASLEIEFRAEALLGNTLLSSTDLGDGEARHALVRPSDGTVVARGRTRRA